MVIDHVVLVLIVFESNVRLAIVRREYVLTLGIRVPTDPYIFPILAHLLIIGQMLAEFNRT